MGLTPFRGERSGAWRQAALHPGIRRPGIRHPRIRRPGFDGSGYPKTIFRASRSEVPPIASTKPDGQEFQQAGLVPACPQAFVFEARFVGGLLSERAQGEAMDSCAPSNPSAMPSSRGSLAFSCGAGGSAARRGGVGTRPDSVAQAPIIRMTAWPPALRNIGNPLVSHRIS